MTGYGRGECVRNDRRIKIEIKAVNHRFSDFTIKLPRFLNPFEDRIRKRLSVDIIRGKVDIWINFDSFSQTDALVNVNRSIADSYVEVLSGLSSRYGFGSLQPELVMELLAKHPDIITLDRLESALSTESEQEEVWKTLEDALEEALVQFNEMRNIEGAAVAKDIEGNRTQAQVIVDEIARSAPEALKAQAERLRERLEEAVQKMDQKPDDVRLATELAIISDKGCINEEISRLQSHLSQLACIMQGNEAIGRKLDFLVQELNREANTIGSKSGDVGVTTLVVELKSMIEKMREQAQNLE